VAASTPSNNPKGRPKSEITSPRELFLHELEDAPRLVEKIATLVSNEGANAAA